MDKIRCLMVTALVFVAGCGEIMTNAPLTDPTTGAPDENLLGHWIAGNNESEVRLFIGRHDVEKNPKSIMECVQVSWDSKTKKVESARRAIYFTVSKLNEACYANFFDEIPAGELSDLSQPGSYEKWAANEKRRCNVIRYACDGKKLQYWIPSSNKLETLDQVPGLKILDRYKKPSKGATNGGTGFVVTRIVTAGSLAAYLIKNGGRELFSELMGSFSRVAE